MESNSAQANPLIALLGLVLGPISGQVGVQCSPITAIGLGSGSSWYAFLLSVFLV